MPGPVLYQLKQMTMGLKGSPKKFSKLFGLLFSLEFDASKFACSIHDLVIIIEDYEENLKLVERFFKTLLEIGLKVDRDKCEFACSSVNYLGYLLDRGGLRPDPKKVKAVLEIPSTMNVKELQTVLGMFGWYSWFFENETVKKMLLIRLLRMESP